MVVVQQVCLRPHRVLLLLQVLQRCLNARQFALKLIANVSYGYTSASFSGRMPCAELADAIVQVRSGIATGQVVTGCSHGMHSTAARCCLAPPA